MQQLDLNGMTFGRWTVLRMSEKTGSNWRTFWWCKCACGTVQEVSASSLNTGHTKSCGCGPRKGPGSVKREHKRAYDVWQAMRKRCRNPSHKSFARYGGRGITVCERWEAFPNFLADMGDPPAGQSLDRRDNDRGYSPDNCRWATMVTQSRNRHTSHRIEFQGRTWAAAEMADHFGINRQTFYQRLQRGIPLERAIRPRLHRFDKD